MSAIIIDSATRDPIGDKTVPLRAIQSVECPFKFEGDRESAMQLVAPRSRFGPLFGLTRRDIEHAITRIEMGTPLTRTYRVPGKVS